MIYLDNAATTQTLEEIAKVYSHYLTNDFFNPSAPYHEALQVSNQVKQCRESILRLIKGDGNIVFTASGTESDNLAMFGTRKANNSRIIVSESEHAAVYNTALEMKQRGYDVVFTSVDAVGRVNIDDFAKNMTVDTSFVSVMHVNNETGCINDIKKLCEIAKKINPSVIFHSDGVQAIGKINVSMQDLGVDLYSISGHKIHAPKGIGALYIKKGINIKPMIFGGGQESNIRSSTENVAGIVCFAKALEIAMENIDITYANLQELCAFLQQSIDKTNAIIISDNNCSPYIFCLALKYVRGEVMLHSLEKHGILIGTGSACASKKNTKRIPSLLNLAPEYIDGIIRVSFNRFTTKSDIEYFINMLNLEYSQLIKYVRG